MSRPDVTGRLQKRSIMLEEHNITYRPRTSVKGQILADFLIKMPDENPQAAPVAETQQEPWTLFTDGSSCVDGSGAGLILTNPEGIEFTYALRFQSAASNNEAEYEALIVGLRIAAQMGVKNVHINRIHQLFDKPSTAKQKQKNNQLCVLVEVLKDKYIKEEEMTTVVEEDRPTWITPIVEYLKEGTLPSDRKEARKLRIKARQYELVEVILYRRSFLTPSLRCVGPLQAEYVIREIHEGSCSMHAGPRSVVAKAIRLGYYWQTMQRDARDMIQKCNDCQIHRHITRSPQQPLTPITAPWPFYKWGIDIAGPFPEGPEIGMPTYRTAAVDVVRNDEELRLNLDPLEEQRERAAICEAKAKLKMTKYYNARVRGVTFRPGDFVYRSNDASHAVARGKLGPKWEGPYEVTEALGDGAYKLRSMDGTILPKTWNIANLKRCYL
nr:reverse transcriptase domain-containing protein [Tanacetum cinerariifolium]